MPNTLPDPRPVDCADTVKQVCDEIRKKMKEMPRLELDSEHSVITNIGIENILNQIEKGE